MPAQKRITFILPTMNRKAFIARAIDSCLACENEWVRPQVLVIDGQSTDGSYEMLQAKYAGDARVKLTQNAKGTGFQETAYQGVRQLDTELATFMYDDDILSPHYGALIAQMIQAGKESFIGYGQAHEVSEAYPFPSVELRPVPKGRAALLYFGAQTAEMPSPPVSPICTVSTSAHLKSWVGFSTEFARRSAFRKYFMLDLNIGPDIIIFLSDMLKEDRDVLLADGPVAQLSVHPQSMSVGYGEKPLSIGYWVGRIWAFEELCRQGMRHEAAAAGAYLILNGTKLWLSLVLRGRWRWVLPMAGELLGILARVIRQATLTDFARETLRLSFRRWSKGSLTAG
jgi:glycosyltransferase involved in cell wall biosynthesis